MNHVNYLDEIAPEAARLNGQNWDDLHATNRQIILDIAGIVTPGGGQSALEKACGQAIAEWYERQRQPKVEDVAEAPIPAPKKTKQSKK